MLHTDPAGNVTHVEEACAVHTGPGLSISSPRRGAFPPYQRVTRSSGLDYASDRPDAAADAAGERAPRKYRGRDLNKPAGSVPVFINPWTTICGRR